MEGFPVIGKQLNNITFKPVQFIFCNYLEFSFFIIIRFNLGMEDIKFFLGGQKIRFLETD
jgi:hypothetical protein